MQACSLEQVFVVMLLLTFKTYASNVELLGNLDTLYCQRGCVWRSCACLRCGLAEMLMRYHCLQHMHTLFHWQVSGDITAELQLLHLHAYGSMSGQGVGLLKLQTLCSGHGQACEGCMAVCVGPNLWLQPAG